MNLSLTATILWAAGFILNAALLFVLLYKKRYRIVPWFTMLIASDCLDTVLLFLTYRFASKHVYADLYWFTGFLDIALQIAVILEIAAIVLRRSGRWVEGTRIRLILMGVAAPLVAFLFAWFMKPSVESKLYAWVARASLFTTILVFLLFIAVVMASHHLGLGWRNYAMRESYGFFIWVIVAFVTDTLHAYWRTLGDFAMLDNIRIAVFQLASIYWITIFWLPEPTVTAVSAENIILLEALQERLQSGQRSH